MKHKPNNGDQPATQADLAIWGGELTRRIDGLEGRLDRIEATMVTKEDLEQFATKEDLQQYATKEDLRDLEQAVICHFNVVAENIHQDVAGANRDEIVLMKDHIVELQRHAGLTREG
jgi:hypothetical protein